MGVQGQAAWRAGRHLPQVQRPAAALEFWITRDERTGRLEASVARHDAAPEVVISVSMPFLQALPYRVAADQTA
jgi:hypothetical protein